MLFKTISMKINPCTSLVGFLVALSTLSVAAVAHAVTAESEMTNDVAETDLSFAGNSGSNPIEDRLSRLSVAFQNRADQLPSVDPTEVDRQIAQGGWGNSRRGAWLNGRDGGWADGRDGGWLNGRRGNGWADGRGGEWLNGRRGGWADGRGGSFLNSNPWSNGWSDGRFRRDRWR